MGGCGGGARGGRGTWVTKGSYVVETSSWKWVTKIVPHYKGRRCCHDWTNGLNFVLLLVCRVRFSSCVYTVDEGLSGLQSVVGIDWFCYSLCSSRLIRYNNSYHKIQYFMAIITDCSMHFSTMYQISASCRYIYIYIIINNIYVVQNIEMCDWPFCAGK